ncbi:MAG: sugar ABC transporter permease [Actinomycetota bacterium]|nr:sugar ABC transporter permease [Actinomycetota bacterium]
MTTTAVAPPIADRPPAPRGSARTSLGEAGRAGWLFSTPFLVIYVLFLIGPVLIGLVISLFNTSTVSSGVGEWVGLSNYADVLKSPDFWASMWHTTIFTLLTTPLLVLVPLLFAILAGRLTRNRWFFRLAFFAPYVVPSAAVCLIFAFMYTPETGLITKAFSLVGLTAPNFLGSTGGAWFAVTLLTLWWTFGLNFILYTAAIQDISEDVYEASAIDGASPWQQITRITVPLLRPTIGLVLILQILASLKVFDQIYILLAGGPGNKTRPVIEYIYDTGFTSYRGGYASAATMVYVVILIIVSAVWVVLRRVSNKTAKSTIKA